MIDRARQSESKTDSCHQALLPALTPIRTKFALVLGAIGAERELDHGVARLEGQHDAVVGELLAPLEVQRHVFLFAVEPLDALVRPMPDVGIEPCRLVVDLQLALREQAQVLFKVSMFSSPAACR